MNVLFLVHVSWRSYICHACIWNIETSILLLALGRRDADLRGQEVAPSGDESKASIRTNDLNVCGCWYLSHLDIVGLTCV